MDKPFGGITFVFGGEPCQILPVVHYRDCPKIVKACVKSSHLWNQVHHIQLTKNMRVDPGKVEFSKYLLGIGKGTAELFPDIGDQVIKVPDEFLVKSLSELVGKVFPEIQDGYGDKYYVTHHAILTPKNQNVDRINTCYTSFSRKK